MIIAGSDSSGGAGIQADIKTVTSLGSYALTAITAVTVQNTKGVKSVISIPPNEIIDQISFFINAKIVLSPYGSGLANIVFCNPGTKIYEIGPNPSHLYDQTLAKRYENLCKICNLDYHKFICDSVDVKNHNQISKKYIHESMLKDSNFFKNMILKLSDVDVILKKIQQPTDAVSYTHLTLPTKA